MAHKNNGGAEMTAAAVCFARPGNCGVGGGAVCLCFLVWLGRFCGPVWCRVRFIFMFWRILGHRVIPEIFKCFFCVQKMWRR